MRRPTPCGRPAVETRASCFCSWFHPWFGNPPVTSLMRTARLWLQTPWVKRLTRWPAQNGRAWQERRPWLARDKPSGGATRSSSGESLSPRAAPCQGVPANGWRAAQPSNNLRSTSFSVLREGIYCRIPSRSRSAALALGRPTASPWPILREADVAGIQASPEDQFPCPSFPPRCCPRISSSP